MVDDSPQIRSFLRPALEDAGFAYLEASDGSEAVDDAEASCPDLIVLDTMKPDLIPSGRVLSAWIHNGQPSDIETVMLAGQFIMREHEILTVDEAAIMEAAYQIGERVWGRILEGGPLPLPRL